MFRDRQQDGVTRASFPLFQMIYNDLSENDMANVPTTTMRTKICRIIKDMDDYHMELVYAIIRCYHLQIDRRPIFENPYQMKKVKSFQFRFDIDNLPDVLILIIDRFVDMYEQKKQDSVTGNLPNAVKA